jgi:lysine-specific demethylase 8
MRRIPRRDRYEFNTLFLLQHYFPNNAALAQRRTALESRIADETRRRGFAPATRVERVERISPQEFRAHHLRKGIPLVIERGAADWPLASRWSFHQFRHRYGNEIIKLVQRKGLADETFVEEREYAEAIAFGDFLDIVEAGGRKYMRFSPLLEKFPELLDDFDHAFFRNMSGNGFGITYQLFVGGAGSYTPLHNAMTPFFFVNVCGVKRWTIFSNHFLPILRPHPDGFGYNYSDAAVDLSNVADYPGFDCIDRLEVELQPLDILYLPAWMWHAVKNDSPTIGVRCGFVDPVGMLRESFTLSFIRLFAARNPSTPRALYHVFIKPNLPERDKWMITPKLIKR